MVPLNKASKDKRPESSLLGDQWWFRLLSGIYVAGAFYTEINLVSLRYEANKLSYQAGIGYLWEASPSIFLYLDNPLSLTGFLSIFKPLHFFGIFLFLVTFYLPVLSKSMDRRFGKEYLAWSRGLLGGLIGFIFLLVAGLVPFWRIYTLPIWVMITIFWGIVIGFYQASLKPDYLNSYTLSSDNKRMLLMQEIDKYKLVVMLLIPILLALALLGPITVGFTTPMEAQESRLASYDLQKFLNARGTAFFVSVNYILIEVIAFYFIIGLRVHIAYNKVKKLLIENEPIDV